MRRSAVLALTLAAACSNDEPTFEQIAPTTYAMVYRQDVSRGETEDHVRDHCRGKQFCKVLGWPDSREAARSFPLTDREAKTQRFDYTLNRNTGMDEAKWL